MAPSFQVHLLTPERPLYEGQGTSVSLRSGEGDIAFLANHAPFIGTVDICVVKIERDGEPTLYAAVHGGFVSVARNEVRVLADVAELANEIDLERAKAALAKAEAAGSHTNDSVLEASLRRAHVRISVSSTLAHSTYVA
ncbi:MULTISPECIES: ATP synthase F1 subunit epsilon [Acidithrix]|uniref:ATP synthase epsilon chain n=1 Tax=Acidithrix ferrooxidans TaxID=1280514 RepID=A0A0D8HH44_9ACTN|nr:MULTISPECIES: ATP synthase F1 subunit epsilon [Acidithrix]KJF17248.1 ATP synthase epsilon chain [Acidithrix ferrooxidans]CAG4929366.1 unnamed protein product [Acidithrix sp. C25]